MKHKKIIGLMLCFQIAAAYMPVGNIALAANETQARQVEYLKRGGYAALKSDGSVYLSWRLLGTEPIDQKFDVYRNDKRIASGIDATNYNDTSGSSADRYRIERADETSDEPEAITVITTKTSSSPYLTYIDIPLDIPKGGTLPARVDSSDEVPADEAQSDETQPEETQSGYTYVDTPYNYAGSTFDKNGKLVTDFVGAQNASVADVDGDGEYEYIVNWDPSNRKDNTGVGHTGNVYIDCYELDGTRKWRIDLGPNIRAGSHYTQFIVYDFDGDGRAEMALRTAPGSKDGKGNYVSRAGAPIGGEPLTWKDSYTGKEFTDESDMRCKTGTITADGKHDLTGKIMEGPDWLTMFNGETGEAMQTVNFYPQRGDVTSWGDDYGNRSERYNACAAYLDGVHPSLIFSRGYYQRAAMAAYDWDGESFTILWKRDDIGTGRSKSTHSLNMDGTLYGNGNHQVTVCDADNDGRDDIVFGSTVVKYDGTILNSTDHGHGDALHASDFNNDGEQEIFSVHEEKIGYTEFGAELRKAKNADIMTKQGAVGDVGRGLMGNFDDTKRGSEFLSLRELLNEDGTKYYDTNLYDMQGNVIGTNKNSGGTSYLVSPSFLVWWDGDLEREILRGDKLYELNSEQNLAQTFKFPDVTSVSKDAPLLQADLFGDWREEVCYPHYDVSTGEMTLRIFLTTDHTDYKMPTLMHDTQYREAVAWQNVGYNQPPHTKFFVGKDALASNGKYLAPAAEFDTVEMIKAEPITVNIKATGDIAKTIRTYSALKYSSELNYAFPRYILEGTTVYEAAANKTGSYYGGKITSVTKSTDIEISYIKKYENAAALEDLDADTGKSASTRASGCLASDNKQYTSEYKLQPGKKYTIMLHYYNADRGTLFMADGKILMTTTVNNTGDSSSDPLTWDFTKISEAGSSNGLSYSGGTFATDAAAYYTITKNGGSLKFTPNTSGTLEISAEYSGGSKSGAIIVDTDNAKNTDDDITFTKSGTNTVELTEGVTYYIYNPNSGEARISSITFTKTETEALPVNGTVALSSWGDFTLTGVTVEKESSLYTALGSTKNYDPLDTILIIEEQTSIDCTTAKGVTSEGKNLQQMAEIAENENVGEKKVEITSAADQGTVAVPSDVTIVINEPYALKNTILEAKDGSAINVEIVNGTESTMINCSRITFGADGKIKDASMGATMSTAYSSNGQNYKDLGFFSEKPVADGKIEWTITRTGNGKSDKHLSPEATVTGDGTVITAIIFVTGVPVDETLNVE